MAPCRFVSEVINEKDLETVAQKLCAELLESKRTDVNLTKAAVNFGIGPRSLDAAMAQENNHKVMLSLAKDSLEALSAFNERGGPKYHDK